MLSHLLQGGITMSDEAAFLVALGITLASSLLVILYFQRPMRGLLMEHTGNSLRATFWVAYSNLILLLLPIVCLLLAQGPMTSVAAPVLALSEQLKWSFGGLACAVVMVSATLSMFVWPTLPQIMVSSRQIDDLERLLEKVEEHRAREIAHRASGSRN
jgi:hypothetical protein